MYIVLDARCVRSSHQELYLVLIASERRFRSRHIRPLVRARNNIHDICYKGGGKKKKKNYVKGSCGSQRKEDVGSKEKKTARDYASARFLETK